jgi:predicted nucleotidyltransferase
MTDIYAPSSRPLEARKADALSKIASATQEWSSQPMLVGAFARDVWFWHLNGIETERATEDLDISMEFPDWKDFDSFAEVLLTQGFIHPITGHPEKFIDPDTKQKLDLLPFGNLSQDGRSIIWPADNSSWSILGFEESYQTAALLHVTPVFAVRIATLPAMVVLKCIAFYERLEDRKRKDGGDIAFTLAHYLDVGNKARLINGSDTDIMDLVEGDIQLAGAVLLGRDMGRMARPVTHDLLTRKLRMETSSSTFCPLAKEIRSHVTRGDFARARVLLRGLLAGLEAAAHA